MTERTVIHDTFVIERTYPATPSRAFAAFASEEAKERLGRHRRPGSLPTA